MNKIVSILTICAVVVSLTYFSRFVMDIGCANAPIDPMKTEKGMVRSFMGINCWFWGESFQLTANL